MPSHIDEQQFRDLALQYFYQDNHGHLEIRGARLRHYYDIQTSLEGRRRGCRLLIMFARERTRMLKAIYKVCNGLWHNSPTCVRLQSPWGIKVNLDPANVHLGKWAPLPPEVRSLILEMLGTGFDEIGWGWGLGSGPGQYRDILDDGRISPINTGL